MNVTACEATIGQMVAARPHLAAVFEESGIDYWCRGDRTLAEACAETGSKLGDLLAACESATPTGEPSWLGTSLSELADHIESTHHAYLRVELPRLSLVLEKVARTHRREQPVLSEVQRVFTMLCREVDLHLMKEEQALFPIFRQLDRSDAGLAPHDRSVTMPIHMMEHEHDGAAAAMAHLRQLTSGFLVPDSADEAYHDAMNALARLETDLHRHIHKENQILFPAAVQREADLATR